MSPGHRPRAKKSLGQNFLVDPNLQRKIVGALGAAKDDVVVEIGPGQGALTHHLADVAGTLVLVELDDALAEALRRTFEDRSSVRVIHADVLEVDLSEHVPRLGDAMVIGNIPYNITTPILFHLLTLPRPRSIVLMVQEEVADRIVAPVGTKSYGALSVGVRAIAKVEKLFRVRRGAFRPVPGVDSAVIRIEPMHPPLESTRVEETTRRLVRSAFQWRRKQLGTILRSHGELRIPAERIEGLLALVGLDTTVRPERISPEQFTILGRALADG